MSCTENVSLSRRRMLAGSAARKKTRHSLECNALLLSMYCCGLSAREKGSKEKAMRKRKERSVWLGVEKKREHANGKNREIKSVQATAAIRSLSLTQLKAVKIKQRLLRQRVYLHHCFMHSWMCVMMDTGAKFVAMQVS